MKRLSFLLFIIVFSLIPVTAVSAQKVTPGSTCKVLKQKVVFQKKTYTCKKSGKKLVWNNGVAVKTPTPTPTPKVLKYFKITQTRQANCTSQNINSTLSSARLIVPSSGGGTGSAKYVYKPGTLSSGTHGASVSAGTREYWTKATFQSPFVYQSSQTWYADVEITCVYSG